MKALKYRIYSSISLTTFRVSFGLATKMDPQPDSIMLLEACHDTLDDALRWKNSYTEVDLREIRQRRLEESGLWCATDATAPLEMR